MILICGLPSSGNRLVQTHVNRGTIAKAGGEEGSEVVEIWHGMNEYPRAVRLIQNGQERDRIMLVVPVRDETMRQASVAKREATEGKGNPLDVQLCRRNTLKLMVEMDLPIHLLPYEGLVANPDKLGRHLFEWLGLPWVPWPTHASDDPAQPYLGTLYNANDAHR